MATTPGSVLFISAFLASTWKVCLAGGQYCVTETNIIGYGSQIYCTYGCCSTGYSIVCCSTPVWVVIMSVLGGLVAVVMLIVLFACCCCRPARFRRGVFARHSQPLGTTVISTTTTHYPAGSYPAPPPPGYPPGPAAHYQPAQDSLYPPSYSSLPLKDSGYESHDLTTAPPTYEEVVAADGIVNKGFQ